MRKKLLIVVVALVAITVVYITFFRKPLHQEVTPIKICYKSNANFLPYFVAKEKGYFEAAGLNIEAVEMESTNLMIEGVLVGRLHVNPMNSVPSLYAVELNTPGVLKMFYIALMATGRTNDAILVPKNSKITTLVELKGKKIGGFPGAANTVFTRLVFKEFMDPANDIQIVELEPRLQLQALAVGQVDALFTFEPLITMGEEKGISRILVKEPIEKYVMDPIPVAGGIMSMDFVQKNPRTARKIVEVFDKAVDFIRKNEAEAKRITAKDIKLQEETASRIGINNYWKLDDVQKDYVQKFANILHREGILQKPVDTSKMFLDLSAIPK